MFSHPRRRRLLTTGNTGTQGGEGRGRGVPPKAKSEASVFNTMSPIGLMKYSVLLLIDLFLIVMKARRSSSDKQIITFVCFLYEAIFEYSGAIKVE